MPVESIHGTWLKEFIDGLPDEDAAEVVAAMAEVREQGLSAARHLRGEIYEVRAEGRNVAIRILFAQEGKKGSDPLFKRAIVRLSH